jgi:hypothetical protein
MTQSIALLLSIVTEAIVAFVLVGACRWGSAWRAALAATLGTLATHWAAWWGILWLADAIDIAWLTETLDYALAVAIAESAVVLVEAIGYRLIVPLPWGRALVASFVANAASTAFAMTLYALDLA